MEMERLWAPWRMEYVKQVDKGDGCFLCRAKAGNVVTLKKINDALGQGSFRTNDGEIDSSFLSGLGQGLKIGGFYIEVLGDKASAGVSGSYVYLLDLGTLTELPYQGVLPGSASNNQNLQCFAPFFRLLELIIML